MFHRPAAFFLALLALLLLTCGDPVPLTLSIGSGAIALVQNGVMGSTGTPVGGGPVGTSLPVASTAGNALVLIAANATTPTGPTVTSMPTGFVLLASIRESTNSDYEVWVWLNNPGGIQGVTFQTVLTGQWYTHLSEWSNVASASAAESTGTATATSGTTLTPPTTVVGLGNLALTGWIQKMASGTCTFTSPGGFTRLIDNGSTSGLNHLDIEYKLSPNPGALVPIPTSDATTNATAAGLTLILKRAPQATDMSAFIA